MNVTLARGKRIDTGKWVYGIPESKKEFRPRRDFPGERRIAQVPEWHYYLLVDGEYVEVIPGTMRRITKENKTK